MSQQRHEQKAAIENCVRSFIIKAIHAIVQARNGIVYNTNCISAVGARNNLMVNIEEDPEIGATIKQTLDAGFPVRVRDIISLEILTAWPNGERMVVEVWQFRLDTANRLDLMSSEQSAHSSPIPDKLTDAVSPDCDVKRTEDTAVEDFRQSRLIEKLGTLLKGVMAATRLLPAYRLSRNQDPSKYQMCYTLRRGSTNLARLGSDVNYQQVGRLPSGLAVHCSKQLVADPQKLIDFPEMLDRVFLNCAVHFRLQPPTSPSALSFSSWSKATISPHEPDDSPRSVVRSRRLHDPRNTIFSPGLGLECHGRQLSRLRPAFAQDALEDPPDDDHADAHHLFLNAAYPGSPQRDLLSQMWPDDVSDDDDDDLEGGFNEAELDENDDVNADLSESVHPNDVQNETVNQTEHSSVPLQLPFSTVGVSGDRLTHLFEELREHANLDLFQVPPSSLGAAGTNPSSQAQSSLFDADALSDELERHEKMLKEFDDFLAVFCRLDSFTSEVHPLVHNALLSVRPAHFGTDAP